MIFPNMYQIYKGYTLRYLNSFIEADNTPYLTLRDFSMYQNGGGNVYFRKANPDGTYGLSTYSLQGDQGNKLVYTKLPIASRNYIGCVVSEHKKPETVLAYRADKLWEPTWVFCSPEFEQEIQIITEAVNAKFKAHFNFNIPWTYSNLPRPYVDDEENRNLSCGRIEFREHIPYAPWNAPTFVSVAKNGENCLTVTAS